MWSFVVNDGGAVAVGYSTLRYTCTYIKGIDGDTDKSRSRVVTNVAFQLVLYVWFFLSYS